MSLGTPVCMGKDEYAALESELQRRAYELGLASLPYPQKYRGICGAVRPRGFVVVPNGDLHKCWDTVSMPAMRVGSIFRLDQYDADDRVRAWTSWSPFDNAICKTCKLLPTCAGSCAHKFINPEQTLGEAASLPCPSWKYQINERLIMLAEQDGAISSEDYSDADIATDPSEICPGMPRHLSSAADTHDRRRYLPIVEVS